MTATGPAKKTYSLHKQMKKIHEFFFFGCGREALFSVGDTFKERGRKKYEYTARDTCIACIYGEWRYIKNDD